MNPARHHQPISVVMPVYNALPYLGEAVESILAQTLGDFEFVIYDDRSTDGSLDELRCWAKRDKRIRLVAGKRNLGPVGSSNEVVRHSSGKLVARMDADDISLPQRLERQAAAFADRPDAGVVASMSEVIDSRGRKVRGAEYWRLGRRGWLAPFQHGSMMIRRDLFDSVGGYREGSDYWEDLDLVHRLSAAAPVLVLPEVLYRYRQSPSSSRVASDSSRVENAMDRRYRCLERLGQDRDYDDLLAEKAESGDARVDPRVFVSLGTLAIWSQKRPSLVRRFLKRARLKPNLRTAFSAAWVLWARASPGSLRAAITLSSRLRNALRESPTGGAIEWRPAGNRGGKT
jgi:glycosyltransferase involved in cell wall biosynthesis